jgi:hypothetical protein
VFAALPRPQAVISLNQEHIMGHRLLAFFIFALFILPWGMLRRLKNATARGTGWHKHASTWDQRGVATRLPEPQTSEGQLRYTEN